MQGGRPRARASLAPTFRHGQDHLLQGQGEGKPRPYILRRFIMIDIFETYAVEPSGAPTRPLSNEHDASSHRFFERFRLLRQVLRFGWSVD